MSILISDCAQSEVISCADSILWSLCIDDCKSEPHYKHQNFSECHYQTVKHITDTILFITGALVYSWLLYLIHICFLLNHTNASGINGIPITKAEGSTADISTFLRLRFYKPVSYKVYDLVPFLANTVKRMHTSTCLGTYTTYP